MFGRLVNLPFRVLGTVARAVQEREAARAAQDAPETAESADAETISLDVPADFDPGAIRISGKRCVSEGGLVVDVGSRSEWLAEHPVGAMHIPAPEIGIRLAELPPSTRIVMIGRKAAEGEAVVRFLRFRGLDDTWTLRGGLAAWTRAGGNTESGEDG
jgi:rhodanese-related sulfurtransferase